MIGFFLVQALSALEAIAGPSPRPVLQPPVIGHPQAATVQVSSSSLRATPAAVNDTLVQVAQIYPATSGRVALGDTDHDGRNEVVLWTEEVVNGNLVDELRILEEQGDNNYVQVLSLSIPFLVPGAIGDLDGDGRSEILGHGGGSLHIYESVDATSHPTELVWTSPYLSNSSGHTTIADTDRDGRMEIIHSNGNYSNSLIIFENTGDNAFTQVYLGTPCCYQVSGRKVIADLDGDGLLEIAFCGDSGFINIFESPSDDVWQQTFVDTTGLNNAYWVRGGVDTDGNGKPELFVAGDGIDGKTTHIYETSADNQFTRVATFLDFTLALGNLDGYGRQECVAGRIDSFGDWYLRVYRAVAPSQWALIYSFDDPAHSRAQFGVECFDVNDNGRDEVFWLADGLIQPTNYSLVLEHPPVDVTSTPPRTSNLSFSIAPNPTRTWVTLHLEDASDSAATLLSIFDVAGRLVDRRLLTREGGWRFSAESLPAGTYWLRLEGGAGGPTATRRVTIVR